MAQIGENYLMQQHAGNVSLFHRYTEEEIVAFDPADGNAAAKAQQVIAETELLNTEEKSFAHFWSGYFYAWAQGTM